MQTVELMLGDLPQVAEEWECLSDGERVSWSTDWSNEMSGLEHLAQYASEGLLSDGQRERYQRLLEQVMEALPVLRRLNLYHPPIVLPA